MSPGPGARGLARHEICAVILAGGAGRRMGGRDKALLPFAGRTLIENAVARLLPQVGALAIAAGGDGPGAAARFAALAPPLPRLPLLPDPPQPPAPDTGGTSRTEANPRDDHTAFVRPVPLPRTGNGGARVQAGTAARAPDLTQPGPRPAPRQGPLAGILAGLLWARSRGAAALVSAPVDTPFLPPDLVARLAAEAGMQQMAPVLAASASGTHPVVALWPVALVAPLAEALATGERRVGRFAAHHGAREAHFGAGPPDPFLNLNTPDEWQQAEALARHGPRACER